ncbi:MAG: hypothetical protein QG639_482 [Patescibacteria group bacterium]|nr:hypothetical protein [Patescibacteria group bacterium]
MTFVAGLEMTLTGRVPDAAVVQMRLIIVMAATDPNIAATANKLSAASSNKLNVNNARRHTPVHSLVMDSRIAQVPAAVGLIAHLCWKSAAPVLVVTTTSSTRPSGVILHSIATRAKTRSSRKLVQPTAVTVRSSTSCSIRTSLTNAGAARKNLSVVVHHVHVTLVAT